jgi:hypothetical protein
VPPSGTPVQYATSSSYHYGASTVTVIPLFKSFEIRKKNLMSIEQTDIVDFVNLDEKSGDVLLTISDHLAWDENEGAHLELLQSKLNAYLRFIESGELVREFPHVKGRNVVIDLVGKFPLSEQAKLFIGKVNEAIRDAGFRLQFKVHPSN